MRDISGNVDTELNVNSGGVVDEPAVEGHRKHRTKRSSSANKTILIIDRLMSEPNINNNNNTGPSSTHPDGTHHAAASRGNDDKAGKKQRRGQAGDGTIMMDGFVVVLANNNNTEMEIRPATADADYLTGDEVLLAPGEGRSKRRRRSQQDRRGIAKDRLVMANAVDDESDDDDDPDESDKMSIISNATVVGDLEGENDDSDGDEDWELTKGIRICRYLILCFAVLVGAGIAAWRVILDKKSSPDHVPSGDPSLLLPDIRNIILSISRFGGEEFNRPDTYQRKALDWILAEGNNIVMANTASDEFIPFEDLVVQLYALACTYYSTYQVPNDVTNALLLLDSSEEVVVGPWTRSDRWMISGANGGCDWYGVICNRLGQVEKISLPNNGLTGNIPPELTLLKDTLLYLDLFNNDVHNVGSSGNSFLFELTNLQFLYLGQTFFEHDGIPTQLSQLSRLVELDISFTSWFGPLEDESNPSWSQLTRLEYMAMNGNFFNTTLPDTLIELPNLQYLYVVDSFLTGDLEWVSRMPAIRELWIDDNPLLSNTEIPVSLSSASTLASFSAGNCGLIGSIPASLGNNMNDAMTHLWLNDNALSGDIPGNLSKLSNLQTLSLKGNEFDGGVPAEICSQKDLPGNKLQTVEVDAKIPCECCTCCGHGGVSVQSVVKASELDEKGEETIKVMVGFNDLREENAYIMAQVQKVHTADNNNQNRQSKIKYQFKNANSIAMEVTKAEYDEMQKDPRFSYIEEDFEVKLAYSHPKDEEEHTRRLQEILSYAIAMTQSEKTIPTPPGDAENCVVYTCLVDSGVYVNHEDLPYNLGDGYITGKSFGPATGDLWYRPMNTNHGTNVAGIMFATGGNRKGIVGAIPNPPQTSRICVKVAKVFPDGSDSTLLSTVVEAVEWCVDQGNGAPMVVNLSLATPIQSNTERQVYERIYNDGNVLLIAAAGNAGSSEFAYPASHDSVISVASVNEQERRSSFSQFNSAVELSAPGSWIHVTQASDTGISVTSGTSYTCPFVTAIAARIWAAGPRCANTHIREALQASSKPLGSFVPNVEYGYGLVQALAAHDYLVETLQCDGVPTSEPSRTPTPMPSATSSLQPSQVPTQSPSSQPSSLPSAAPSDIPSSVPSSNPTDSPTIGCQRHLEPCTSGLDCCIGFSCLRLSSDTDDTWACRRETGQLFNTKPRLGAMDGGMCRGGYAGNCPSPY